MNRVEPHVAATVKSLGGKKPEHGYLALSRTGDQGIFWDTTLEERTRRCWCMILECDLMVSHGGLQKPSGLMCEREEVMDSHGVLSKAQI